MNTRKKTKLETCQDEAEYEQAQRDLNAASKEFLNEFIDCEGDVFYSTYTKAVNSIHTRERCEEIMAATKVGDEWNLEKGVVGKWRYPNLRGGE